MYKLALACLLSVALVPPALAQPKEAPKKEAAKPEPAKKVAIPSNTFFRGQQANQYLARERLLGAKVIGKDGQSIGAIDDLIVGSGNQLEGVIVGVGGFLGVGEKKIGVRMSALKITTADGKTTVSLPAATKEMLAALDAYQRAGAAPAKK
jgi:hypothetical protein